jgi:hypothetical protein
MFPYFYHMKLHKVKILNISKILYVIIVGAYMGLRQLLIFVLVYFLSVETKPEWILHNMVIHITGNWLNMDKLILGHSYSGCLTKNGVLHGKRKLCASFLI